MAKLPAAPTKTDLADNNLISAQWTIWLQKVSKQIDTNTLQATDLRNLFLGLV